MNHRIIHGLLIFMVSLPVIANDWPEGVTNTVEFRLNATRSLINEQAVAYMAVFGEAETAEQAALKINTDMQWALKLLGEEAALEYQTTDYQTSPRYAPRSEGKVIGWKAEQGLEIRAHDMQQLMQAIGTLQDRLIVRHLSFEPLPEHKAQAEVELRRELLARFQTQAIDITRELGRKRYRLVQLRLRENQRPEPRMMMKSAAIAAPGLKAGASKISYQLEAVIAIEENIFTIPHEK